MIFFTSHGIGSMLGSFCDFPRTSSGRLSRLDTITMLKRERLPHYQERFTYFRAIKFDSRGTDHFGGSVLRSS